MKAALKPGKSRGDFLLSLPAGAEVFDVGCGNSSPYQFKSIRPDLIYVGLDVGDYNQQHDPRQYADEYVVVSADGFLGAIEQRAGQFDAVVSSHNLEHCADQDAVVIAMARALRPGGRIFMAFPAAATVKLPSRAGSLNFYDDPTHTRPPNFGQVLALLRNENVSIDFAAERYRPLGQAARGLAIEPLSILRKKTMRGTWALYGFESIIWGTRT